VSSTQRSALSNQQSAFSDETSSWNLHKAFTRKGRAVAKEIRKIDGRDSVLYYSFLSFLAFSFASLAPFAVNAFFGLCEKVAMAEC